MFYAHSTNNLEKSDWQPLHEHLMSTAGLAEHYGEVFGLGNAAHLAGLFHDLGKYTPEFQARLEGAPEKVDHSTAGAVQILNLAQGGNDKWIAELIAYTIAGHHAGLPDRTGGPGSLSQRVKDFQAERLDPAWRDELSPDVSGLMPALDFGTAETARFRLGFLGRMLFSCLVDADFKDTEAFFSRIEGRHKNRHWPALQDLLPDLAERYARHMAGLPKDDTRINRLRGEILQTVRERAALPPGLFTLTVPTGGGKTLASLGFALNHARQHGKNRIVYAIPFTSIIDQTADVFKQVLGEEVVLEHHSAIDEQKVSGRDARDKLKLAMEDWAAPLVVTTNVQLFESLFAARPSRCRKLHNIANSVIILDEAQTLPRHLLTPCVQVIDELARNYKCSIVLCTATQPAFNAASLPDGHPLALPLAGRELAPEPARLAEALRRVHIRTAGEMSNANLVAALEEHQQGLVIVNSRRHALELFVEAREAGLDGLVHLTTRQCAAHRRQILASIRQRLKGEQSCRVIATSLVEAGVDLDFPRVWRAESGLDQIAQAAGRCNREGRRKLEDSLVTVFSAPDYPPPPEIKNLSGDMQRIVGKHDDLLSPAAIKAFFGEVYWRLGPELDRERILEDFSVDRTGTSFAYRSVAEKFRMIESGMLPVIVPWDTKARQAVEDLAIEAIPSGVLARRLQTYIVQLPPKDRAKLIDNGHVRFAQEDKRGDQFAVLEECSDQYREETGLVWEDADYLGLKNGIF